MVGPSRMIHIRLSLSLFSFGLILSFLFFLFLENVFPSKSTFFSLNPNAFLILPGIGRGEFCQFRERIDDCFLEGNLNVSMIFLFDFFF